MRAQVSTFTDDDLKRLKERQTNDLLNLNREGIDINALLARLEAAELCADKTHFHFFRSKGDYPNEMERELGESGEAWRKTAGK